MQDRHPEEPGQKSPSEEPERAFQIGRLLGAIGIVLVVLAGAAVLVDVLVLGW